MANITERPPSCKTVGNPNPNPSELREYWNKLLDYKMNLLDERDRIELEVMNITKELKELDSEIYDKCFPKKE